MGPEQLVVARLTKYLRVGTITRDVVVQGPATVATGETLAMIFAVPHGKHLGREDLSGRIEWIVHQRQLGARRKSRR